MKRAYRLRRPDQFQRVRREGRSWESSLIKLQAHSNHRRTTRCGFVVTKRLGGAVERNRCKRRAREVVRLMYDAIAPGWDLVFIIRSPEVATVDFVQLQTTIERLLQRAKLWREQPQG